MRSTRSHLGALGCVSIATLKIFLFADLVEAGELPEMIPLEVTVHIEGDRNDRRGSANEWVGTKRQGRRLEMFKIEMIDSPPDLSLQYYCHLQDIGDTDWLSEGRECGTRNQGRRLEEFGIQLTRPNARYYNVFYDCHVQKYGDVGWRSNGEPCGVRGKKKRIEAIRVKVVHK